MLPLVVCAGVLMADLARPVSPQKYRRAIGHQILLQEPLLVLNDNRVGYITYLPPCY
jgi:hypothetical protein